MFFKIRAKGYAMDLHVGDVVKMKKPHPCGSDLFTVTRTGADLKLRCRGCAREILMPRPLAEKRIRATIKRTGEEENGQSGI